jgi:glycosyltransferase involved in cell wall biosynthesis
MRTTQEGPARRLRIAYVVHDYHRRGGHSRYVAELASRFKHDHEVHIFANTFDEPDADNLTVHHVPAWRVNVVSTLLTFSIPATFMVRDRFDIVHAQGFCGLRQNVVTAHICQGAWHEAMIRHAGRPGWRKRIFHALATRLERFTYRPGGAQRFIAVSRRVRENLESHYGRRDHVRVIYHGVDRAMFHPRNRALWRERVRRAIGLTDEACVALYVGDLQKAMPAAVRALARVPSLHLVTVSGSSTAPYRALIEDANLGQRVHMLPATQHVERCYAAADLFVFPTFYDSFGLVATEAMASGLPVVCGAAAGASELIEHGVNGLIVSNGWDQDELADALSRLVADPGLRGRLGSAARETIEPHTWDEVARQTLAVYREVADLNLDATGR